MASTRPKPRRSFTREQSRPAPDAGWHMVPNPKTPPQPATEPEPEKLAVDLLLAYVVDGKPVIGMPLHFDLVVPPAGQGVQVQIPIDARQLVQLLEPHIGPLSRTESGIVVPGSGWVPKH